MGKLYRAVRRGTGVVVFVDDLELPILASQKLKNHSEGFEWGYGGSGPSQLALAILFDCTKDEDLSLEYYQAFKNEFIARADYQGFTLMEIQIRGWLRQQTAEDTDGC